MKMGTEKSLTDKTMHSLFKLSFKVIVAAIIILLSLSNYANSQTFSQFTTAAISSDGEGGFFLKAGNNIFKACAMSRFRLTPKSDIGIQAGIDKLCDTHSYGGAIDVKFFIIKGESLFPLDLSIDLSFGYTRAKDVVRNIFGCGFLISRVFEEGLRFPIEPYLSVNLFSTHYSKKPTCPSHSRRCWPCRSDHVSSETNSVLRAGTRFRMGDDIYLIIEGEIDGEKYMGLGFNIIF